MARIKVVPSSGGVLTGISVIFMKLVPEQGKLDPSDSYESKWTGADERAKRLDSERAEWSWDSRASKAPKDWPSAWDL